MSGGTIGSLGGAIVGGIVGSVIPGFGTMLGISIGSMVGGIAGNLIFPPELEDIYGPRNRNLQLPGSAFGNPISITWGTDRHAGNLIWTSGVDEVPIATEVSNKGGSSQTTINFTYKASYAVAIAAYAGEDTKLLRIWSDNKLVLDMTSTNTKIANPPGLNYRFYIGSETQIADSTIESYEGSGNVPAHRGLIYIVYEDRDLTPYGGRYPSDNFEITTNGTDAYPKETFTFSHTIWGHDNLHIEKDYLYHASGDTWTIINTVNNSFIIKEIHTPNSEVWQYHSLTDIASDGGWWSAKQCTSPGSTVYCGKIDQFIQSYTYVQDSRGFPMVYSVPDTQYGQFIDCVSVIWYHSSHAAYLFSSLLVPLHTWTEYATYSLAIATIPAETDQHLVHGCYAPGVGAVFVSTSSPADADPENDTAWLHVANDDGGYESYEINAQLHRARYVTYEPDSGYIFIGGTGHDTDTSAGAGKIAIYDTSGNYVKTVGYNLFTAEYSSSAFRGIVNHRLWVRGPTNLLSEIDTLTGDIIRTINPVSWGPYTIGFSIYDPASNAIWAVTGASTIVKILLDRVSGTGVPLSTIVEEISNEVSLTDTEIDVTELTDIVYGYTVNQRMSARRAIEPLQLAYFFDGVESDAKIKYLKRALRTSVVTIPEADLSCHDFGAERPDEVAISRQFELEIPKQLDLEYIAPDTDYQQGKQTTTRLITLSKEQKTVSLPICFETDEAKQISEILHYLMWLERNRFRFTLSRKYAYLDNCDVITVTTTEATYTLRITKLEYGAQGLIIVDAVPHDADTFSSASTGNDGEWVPGTEIDYGGQTTYYFMDIPFFRDQDQAYNNEGFYVALSGSGGWHGAMVYKSADGANFAPSMIGINSAKQGVMLGALTDIANPGTWDTTSIVNVQLFNSSDTLSSATELAVLNGANPCVIGNEICQFCNATLVTSNPRVYTLSTFLRGRRGTEDYIADHYAGERFVFISPTTIYRSDLDSSEIGLQRKYCVVSLGDKLNTALQFPYYGYATGLKPYSPVHIEKTLNDANDYTITWIRRTRIGGSWRDLVDVPIGESSENYQIDIYDINDYLIRELSTTSATLTYTAAEQSSDGLTPGDTIHVSIYQMSSIVGRGFKGGDGPSRYVISVPPAPIPTQPPIGTELTWDATSDFLSIGSGMTVNFYVENTSTTTTAIEILVFGESLTINLACQLTFPDNRSWQAPVVYELSTSLFNFRSQNYGAQPNIPDAYMPVGYYNLKITCISGGTYRIRTRIMP